MGVTVHLPSTLVYRVLILPQRISTLYSLTFLNHNKKWFNSDRNRVEITILIFIVVISSYILHIEKIILMYQIYGIVDLKEATII